MSKEKKEQGIDKNIGGIPLKLLLQLSFIVGAALLVFALWGAAVITKKYSQMSSSIGAFSQSMKYMTEMKEYSDKMMEETRMFVITQDPVHITNYFDIVEGKKREKIVQELNNLLSDPMYAEGLDRIKKAMSQSNSLMSYELSAMKLVAESVSLPMEDLPATVKNHTLLKEEESLSNTQKIMKAHEYCIGEKYKLKKGQIDQNIEEAFYYLSEVLEKNAVDNTNSLKTAFSRIGKAVALIFILLLGILLFIYIYVVKPLQSHVRHIRENKRLELLGAREFRFLSMTYNEMYDQNKAVTNRLKYSVEHDALTHVYSRELFDKQKDFLQNVDSPIALLMIDVDYFKAINDKYGHDQGDKALIRVADTLNRTFRSNDIVARIGGDEFAVILIDVEPKDKKQITNKLTCINELLNNPVGNEIGITLSIGLAFSANGYNQELFRHADEALYKTKKNGRNGYTVYEDMI